MLYDYFRAPGPDEVRDHLDDNDAFSPVPETFDGIELKAIEPTVLLGRLVALISGRQWSTDLVGLDLIWPEGGDQDGMHEGPWVCVLDDRTRDTLAATPADRIPDLAERWSTAEEFGGDADRAHLREAIAGLTTLATRAHNQHESLYCWMSL